MPNPNPQPHRSISLLSTRERERKPRRRRQPGQSTTVVRGGSLWVLGLKREGREQSCKEITRERERERELIQNSLIKSRRERELNKNIYV